MYTGIYARCACGRAKPNTTTTETSKNRRHTTLYPMALIRVPQYAKDNAQKGLRKRKQATKSEKFGLSTSEAAKKGVASGVARARQLKRETQIREQTAQDIISFLSRMHGLANQHGYTDKILGSIYLWGGQQDKRFLNYLKRKTS